MRLSNDEIQGIISALDDTINGSASLYLYGSRTKAELKGGDIDLLLVSNQHNLAENKHLLLVAIKNNIGDQRIDLTLSTEKGIENDPFLDSIFKEAILLHRWP